MKLNKKIFMVSAAALMLVSPAAVLSSNVNNVSAAYAVKENMKGKLTLNHNSYVYTKSGKRTGRLLRKGASVKYVGKTSVNNDASNLYFYQNSSSSDKLQLKTTRIKGGNYFQIGKNQYINAVNVDSIDGSSLLVNQTTVVVKKRTAQLFLASRGRALTTGKYYNAGQKLTVDQLGGVDVMSNSTPSAYHIKGTDYYVWAKDVTPRQNMEDIDYAELGQMTVGTKRVSIPIYSFDGEESTPSGYAWGPKHSLSVNGAMYLYNDKTQKSELYYHLTDRYQGMSNLKTSPAFPDVVKGNVVNVGDAFVKASDVNIYGGEKLEPINTADAAEDNSKIAISESDELDLKDLINNADSVKNSVKYKLSSFYKRYNYDQAVKQAQTATNERKLMSAAEAKYLIWSLKTYESELNGAKVKVGNINKLTSNEKLAINLLVINVYSEYTDTENLYGSARFKKGNDKTFTLTIQNERENHKVLSTKTVKTSDFAENK